MRVPIRIAVLIVAIVTIAGVGWVSQARRTQSPSYLSRGTVDFSAAVGYWSDRFSRTTPRAVRAEFDAVASTVSGAGQSHVLAHAFGEASYRTYGLEGFSICDSSYLSGCLHQFVGDALTEHGTAVLPQLADACMQKTEKERFGCLHGVGHGVLAISTYTPAGLRAALSLCAPLDRAHAKYPCADGVFMEYNLRELTTLDDAAVVNPRPYADAARFEPCGSVQRGDQEACYFELPNWWVVAASSSATTRNRVIGAGQGCQLIEQPDLRSACFRGLGHIVPLLSDMSSRADIELCKAASVYEADRIACISEAAWRSTLEGVQGADVLCDAFGLHADALKNCQTYAQWGTLTKQ